MARSSWSRVIAHEWQARTGLSLFALSWLVYWLTDRPLESWDLFGVLLLPRVLWEQGHLYLDGYEGVIPGVDYLTYSHNGREVSFFTPWLALLFLPMQGVLALLTDLEGRAFYNAVQQTTAQVAMALVVAFTGATLRREYGDTAGVLGAVAVGFGTINWFVLSQLAFSNTFAQVLIAAAMYLLVRREPPSGGRMTGALVCLTAMVFLRPNLAILTVAWSGLLMWRHGRRMLLPLVVAGCFGGIFAGGNALYSGSPFAGYGQSGDSLRFFGGTLLDGLLANTISPGRGIFLFSPWVLLAFVGAFRRGEHHQERRLFVGLFCVQVLVVSAHFHWWGGASWGPRFTSDLLPLLALAAAPIFRGTVSRRGGSLVVGGLLTWSVIIAGGHALSDDRSWNQEPVSLDHVPERVFDWRDPLVFHPFIKDAYPYEERFPIRLEGPSDRANLTEPQVVVFSWSCPTCTPGVQYQVEVVRSSDWGQRAGIQFDPTWEPRLTYHLTNEAIQNLRPVCPLYWRVLALDSSGHRIARSGWRWLTVGDVIYPGVY